ncbi:MAG: hypothetical protein HY240_04315 [Actinobacteria bacterium]|nr:hypothetical protein [Actinomycetota bacterium]
MRRGLPMREWMQVSRETREGHDTAAPLRRSGRALSIALSLEGGLYALAVLWGLFEMASVLRLSGSELGWRVVASIPALGPVATPRRVSGVATWRRPRGAWDGATVPTKVCLGAAAVINLAGAGAGVLSAVASSRPAGWVASAVLVVAGAAIAAGLVHHIAPARGRPAFRAFRGRRAQTVS